MGGLFRCSLASVFRGEVELGMDELLKFQEEFYKEVEGMKRNSATGKEVLLVRIFMLEI